MKLLGSEGSTGCPRSRSQDVVSGHRGLQCMCPGILARVVPTWMKWDWLWVLLHQQNVAQVTWTEGGLAASSVCTGGGAPLYDVKESQPRRGHREGTAAIATAKLWALLERVP